MATKAPYMGGAVAKGRAFSPDWARQFEDVLARVFPDDQQLADAAKGYIEFAFDGLRLQHKFAKELKYIHKTFEDVAKVVYHNPEYMNRLYLPGILVSHFLWPHHYRQLQFFWEHFAPRVKDPVSPEFADVGVGTGFYSVQALRIDDAVRGTGYDISASSIEYATKQIHAFDLSERWQSRQQNILTDPPDEKYGFVISVEVLEHLEDPVSFIKGLKHMLAPGGWAFITAAIAAPNEDHIYLYMTAQDVITELEEGGFEVVEYRNYKAYEPRASEPVPISGAFICR